AGMAVCALPPGDEIHLGERAHERLRDRRCDGGGDEARGPIGYFERIQAAYCGGHDDDHQQDVSWSTRLPRPPSRFASLVGERLGVIEVLPEPEDFANDGLG